MGNPMHRSNIPYRLHGLREAGFELDQSGDFLELVQFVNRLPARGRAGKE
jgi:hypothetical protein